MNRAVEVRTPSDGFAATFPKGDGFYPDKLKFTAQLTARALNFQLSTAYPGIGVARDCLAQFFISHTVKKQEKLHEILINFVKTLENIQALG